MEKKKQNQLRIAFLGMKCMPALGQGGVEVVVEELSTRMAKMGHIKAGENAGCKTCLIGKDEFGQDMTVDSLYAFADKTLS